jgi:branched-chain amino acid transport system ATP-binding protein
MALLEAENVRRCFGGVVALNQVSFEVNEGQITAIIGPNGAGKTTLLNVLSGIHRPTAGRIRFDGKMLTGLAPFEIAALGISRTFQNVNLFLHMTVLENVMVGRHNRAGAGLIGCALRLPGERREERAIHDAALAQLADVGLADQAGRLAGTLSFGQRRMVELARALAAQPRLLLEKVPVLLKVKNLRCGYGRLEIVKGVSLHVCAGEIVTLVGANGAGKTSLLRSIAGLLPPWRSE